MGISTEMAFLPERIGERNPQAELGRILRSPVNTGRYNLRLCTQVEQTAQAGKETEVEERGAVNPCVKVIPGRTILQDAMTLAEVAIKAQARQSGG
jgi:hypothetical protein